MQGTDEGAALSGETQRNQQLALQHIIAYEEFKAKIKQDNVYMYKHANAGEGRETPAQLSPGIANCTHPVNMVKERRKERYCYQYNV